MTGADTTRRFGNGDLSPRPSACFFLDCEKPALPRERWCTHHLREVNAWLAEMRRLDNTEDGRRERMVDWENGWLDVEDPVGEFAMWDDPELIDGELVDA